MLLSVVAVLLLILNPVHSDVADFFRGLTDEFFGAWERLKEAIKKPVRLRRLGKIKLKRPKLSSTTTTRLFPAPSTPKSAKRTVRVTPTPLLRRVAIPLLRRPQYQSLVQWSQMQNPFISGLKAHEFSLRGGKGFQVVFEKTMLFPTSTSRYSVSSKGAVVPVLKLPLFKSLEQWRFLQLPRYVTRRAIGTSKKVPTRAAYTVDTNLELEEKEIKKPQRMDYEYLWHTLLTENLIKMDKNKRKTKHKPSRLQVHHENSI